MKEGQPIRVYQDPVTEKFEEGVAALVARVKSVAPCGQREYWRVQFLGEECKVMRWVDPKNLVPA